MKKFDDVNIGAEVYSLSPQNHAKLIKVARSPLM